MQIFTKRTQFAERRQLSEVKQTSTKCPFLTHSRHLEISHTWPIFTLAGYPQLAEMIAKAWLLIAWWNGHSPAGVLGVMGRKGALEKLSGRKKRCFVQHSRIH
jgi:hypothetical protein